MNDYEAELNMSMKKKILKKNLFISLSTILFFLNFYYQNKLKGCFFNNYKIVKTIITI